MNAIITTDTERSLDELETIIEHGIATFVEVGMALAEIRDCRLYAQQGYDTFEAYCHERWNLSRSYAHRLIDASHVATVVSREYSGLLPIGNKSDEILDIPNEAPARELARLKDEDEIIEVYHELKNTYGEEVTAQRVREFVTRRLNRPNPEPQVSEPQEVDATPEAPSPSVDLREGDFREILSDIPDSSVDLIFTFPPSDQDSLPIWKDLSAFAVRVLKPVALLVTSAEQRYLLQIMEALGSSLTYVWLGWAWKRAPYSHIDELLIRSKGRPLLFYVKGEFTPEMPFDDVPNRTGNEEAVIAYYVEILTERGNLVVDPLSGEMSGVVVQRLGRRFVGAEGSTLES
jgi:hypothetical protein